LVFPSSKNPPTLTRYPDFVDDQSAICCCFPCLSISIKKEKMIQVGVYDKSVKTENKTTKENKNNKKNKENMHDLEFVHCSVFF
jgi:hypothetical protein